MLSFPQRYGLIFFGTVTAIGAVVCAVMALVAPLDPTPADLIANLGWLGGVVVCGLASYTIWVRLHLDWRTQFSDYDDYRHG